MSELKAEMKFEVGELVFSRDASHWSGMRPRHFVITERLVQECHGGVQRLYRLNGNGNELIPEIVLTREEPPYRPFSPETLEAMGKEKGLEYAIRCSSSDERARAQKREESE